MIVVDIVKAEATLYAKPPFVGRTIDAVNVFDPTILDLERHLAADAAKRANALNFAVEIFAVAGARAFGHRRRHQRAGWASLHAFAAGDAGRRAHWVIKVKDRE